MKKFLTMLLVTITLFTLAGCLPRYKPLPDDKVVEIFGIEYVRASDIFWRPVNMDKQRLFGEMITPSTEYHPRLKDEIYIFEDDINRMFIALKFIGNADFYADYEVAAVGPEENYCCRSDIAFPAMNSSGVEAIGIRKEGEGAFLNIVQDKETIGQLLDVMSRAEIQEEKENQYIYVLELTNGDFPGIEIQVNVSRQGDEYRLYFNELNHFVYDNSHDDLYYYYYHTVQIPRELLEEIAGDALPG